MDDLGKVFAGAGFGIALILIGIAIKNHIDHAEYIEFHSPLINVNSRRKYLLN